MRVPVNLYSGKTLLNYSYLHILRHLECCPGFQWGTRTKRSLQDEIIFYQRKTEKEREHQTQMNPRTHWHEQPTWTTLQLLCPWANYFLEFFLIYPIFILNLDPLHLVWTFYYYHGYIYILYRMTACDLLFMFRIMGTKGMIML